MARNWVKCIIIYKSRFKELSRTLPLIQEHYGDPCERWSLGNETRSKLTIWLQRVYMTVIMTWYTGKRTRTSFDPTRKTFEYYTVQVWCFHFGKKSVIVHVKPATGRPYVTAFSLTGTVPAFTCDCLRFVCAFTRRRKFDLCMSTSSRTMLAFGNNVSCSSSACSTPTFCRR